MVFERRVSVLIAAVIVVFVLFIVWRGEPFAPDAAAMLRIVLSLAMGILGATIPGFLNLTWRGSGLAVRAAGALALLVLTLVYTPTVLGNGKGNTQFNKGTNNTNSLNGSGSGNLQFNRGDSNANTMSK
jgi:hypothetical protein